MLEDPFLRGLVVVGHYGEDTIDSMCIHSLDALSRLDGVIPSESDHDRTPPCDLINDSSSDSLTLWTGQTRRLSRRTMYHEEVHCLVTQQVLKQSL